MIDTLVQELRYAVRTLARSPGFTLVALLTLALGIGASTAVYTALERVVLDPLPYPEADRLVQLKSAVPGVAPGAEWNVSAGAWFFFRDQARTIDALGTYQRSGVTVLAPGPERARAASVTAGMLRILGAQASRGRLIEEPDDDPNGPAVVVLSHGYWQRRFGNDPHVVGTTISIYEQPYEVIGVMAPGLELPPEAGAPAALLSTDLWLPLRLNSAGPFYNTHNLPTIARLRSGTRLDAAQAEFDRLTARLPDVVPTAYPRSFMQRYGFATRLYPLKQYVLGGVARSLWILFGAVSLVLAIVFANVANLFLVRAEARRREVAIRTALGAGAGAILRHFIAESFVLASAGGALAMVLALWSMDALTHLAPDGVPRLQALRPDGSVILFALGLVLLATIAVAALPALRAIRPSHGAGGTSELAQGDRGLTIGRESQRVRSSLV
ncbi:MAG TPA: ABC transporter permease, partial [Gemmatimonadales bacterium]|nr:ABC transporter permease [Gemmatimonadales bacterium]